MTIPASRVESFIDPKTFQTVELRDVAGDRIGDIGILRVRELLHDDAVVGKCGRSRLKYLKLTKEPTAASGRVRSRTSTELMQRMVASRKFTFRERLMTNCPITGRQEWSGARVTRHKYSSV